MSVRVVLVSEEMRKDCPELVGGDGAIFRLVVMLPAQRDQVLLHVRAPDAFGNDVMGVQAGRAAVLVDQAPETNAVSLGPNPALGCAVDDMQRLGCADAGG